MKQPCLVTTSKSSGELPFELASFPAISPAELDSFDSRNVSFWLVDMSDPLPGWDATCAIRNQLDTTIYLRPIVYLVGDAEIPDEFYQAANGHIKHDNLNQQVLDNWTSRLNPINLWIEKVEKSEAAKDTNIAFRMLRLIASEEREITPLTTTRIKSGFIYPTLEPFFTKEDTGVLEVLDFLLEQKLISNRFVSKAHFCGHCDSAFLNFKESCTQCSSEDIRSDELVHHFKCAYTGELEDFRQGDELICPKCERTLQHIGVDYDKPSIIYNCNHCTHTFQEPNIKATCYHCGRTSEPENLIHRTIYSYLITAIGKNTAIYGLDTLFTRIMESKLHLTPIAAFKEFFAIETARIKRYKISTSSLTLIRMVNMSDIYIRMGHRAKEIFEELSVIFRTTLRTCDVITALNESTFFVIMTETAPSHAERAVERLNERITELLGSNLDITPEIAFEIHNIEPELDLDATLEAFQHKYAD